MFEEEALALRVNEGFTAAPEDGEETVTVTAEDKETVRNRTSKAVSKLRMRFSANGLLAFSGRVAGRKWELNKVKRVSGLRTRTERAEEKNWRELRVIEVERRGVKPGLKPCFSPELEPPR
jgi:hypothetical protein